ncbi:MAG: DUF4340 domain-containing protein [Spirochaetes bacterium]|nr:DUF4340 domain-containing protein [Spirochaetota bacterium]
MNKKMVISVSIIAALLLYIVIANVKFSSDVPRLEPWEGSADEMIITDSKGAVRLFMKDEKWVVGDKAFPADAKLVDDIQKRFREIRLTDLVSTKGFYARYDLTPDKYVDFIIKKEGNILRKFKIGKKSSGSRHTFIKVDDRPDVYLAEGTFDIVLNKSIEDYRDRQVLSIKRDKVMSFSITYQGRTFALSRIAVPKEGSKDGKDEAGAKKDKPGEMKWVCRGYEGIPIDDGRIGSILQSLDPLRAVSFPDVRKEELSQQVCVVQVRVGEKEVTLSVFKSGDGYVATTSENPYVFSAEKWIIEKFFITGIDSLKSGAVK